jgi:hypothetical protein
MQAPSALASDLHGVTAAAARAGPGVGQLDGMAFIQVPVRHGDRASRGRCQCHAQAAAAANLNFGPGFPCNLKLAYDKAILPRRPGRRPGACQCRARAAGPQCPGRGRRLSRSVGLGPKKQLPARVRG